MRDYLYIYIYDSVGRIYFNHIEFVFIILLFDLKFLKFVDNLSPS